MNRKFQVSVLKADLMDFHHQIGYTGFAPHSIVADDPTVLFTNAAVTPFKHAYGPTAKPHENYATIQPCFRYGGTTEVEDIGLDPMSLTWFDMFGSGSFGVDHYQAIQYLFEVLNQLTIELERCYFTVPDDYFNDALIRIGVNPASIFAIDRNGLFWRDWAFGRPGPVGSGLTLIVSRRGRPVPTSVPELLATQDSWVELLNLIAIDRFATASGQIIPLCQPGFDLGMGIERLACVLQECTCYEIDSIAPLAVAVRSTLEPITPSLTEATVRMVTDHLRSLMHLMAANVMPGNKRHGYVVRRCMRRVIEDIWVIGGTVGTLTSLIEPFGKVLGGDLTLSTIQAGVTSVIEQEATALEKVISQGRRLLRRNPTIDPQVLHETHGVTPTLLKLIQTRRPT